MANINIQRSHHFSIEVLRDKIDEIMNGIEEKLEFKSEWENDSEFLFRRKGANGRILISDDSFELDLSLGIMYRALSSQIEKRITAVVNKHI